MIYFDHNATTPLRPDVARLLADAAQRGASSPGNPSSVHRAGRGARDRVDAARETLARLLGCEPKEIVFTGSGSEADALAVAGAFRARKDANRCRIVTTALEHPALLGTVKQLETEGAQIVRVAPEANGQVDPAKIIAALDGQTLLCSVMWANNETGALQPVEEIARACQARGVLCHSDAVNAVGKTTVTLGALDMLSVSAHKFGGPAGVGALAVRRKVSLAPLVPGHQESGRRGGTTNVPYLEALALAAAGAIAELGSSEPRMRSLRDRFEARVRADIEGVEVNGTGPRLCNTSNLRFDGADGEALLIALDLRGICVSAGAACSSGSVTPSHVLTAMGLSSRQAQSSLRFSLGPSTTEAEVDVVAQALRAEIEAARQAGRELA